MANPNIVTTATLNFNGTGGVLTTSLVSILSNAASSGTVLKVVSLYISNIGGSTTTANVTWNNAAAIAGTNYYIANGTSVSAGATIIVIDENSPVYLNENTSIGALASSGSALDYVINYQYISD